MISIVAAKSKNNVIGINNTLPWHIPDDLKNFKMITTNGVIIMGRKTFESIGKPLPNRTNIVITRQNQTFDCITTKSIEDAIKEGKKHKKEIFIIGGAEIYSQTINIADKIYITEIDIDINGDSFFPEIKSNDWRLISKHEKQFEQYKYSFNEYVRIH